VLIGKTSAPSRFPANSHEAWLRVGEIEEAHNFLARKALDPQQMPVVEDERGLLGDVH